jgi:phosphatidylethanolamine/phosphatidyl-N-methylethanolamine N-methyltransferase
VRFFDLVGESFRFFKGFVKDPMSVGSVIPSSRTLARALIDQPEFARSKTIVEIGTGTGALTDIVLENLPVGARYLGLDLNPKFVLRLQQKYPQHLFVSESAANLPQILEREKIPAADFVVSGLPWTLFGSELQGELLQSIFKSLSDQGAMTTFIYLPALKSPMGQRFLRKLREYFPRVEKTATVFKNLPPAAVYKIAKRAL